MERTRELRARSACAPSASRSVSGSGSGRWRTSGFARVERTLEAESGRGSCYSSSCRRASPITEFAFACARGAQPLGEVTVEKGGRNDTVEVFNSKTCVSGSGFHSPRRHRGRRWALVALPL